MIAVKVTTESGHSWTTDISVTIEKARKYFLNRSFNVGLYPVESIEKVVKVELA